LRARGMLEIDGSMISKVVQQNPWTLIIVLNSLSLEIREDGDENE